MKNPNELRKYILFQLNECDAIKEYLEDMARKGWKLKCIRTFFYFERIEPQTLYYSVEVFAKASVYDTIPADTANEYIDYCRQANWEFVCNSGQVHIFVSDSKNTIPIETDEPLKFKTIKKGILKQNAMTWFGLFPLFLFNFSFAFWDFESVVTDNMGLLSFLFYIIFFAVVIIQVVSFISWTAKQNLRLRQNEPIQYISGSGRRKRTLLHLIPLGVITLIVLLFVIYSLIQKDYFTALMMSLVVLLVPIAFLFSHFLQKQGFSRTTNKVIPVFFGLGIGFAITMLAVLLLLPAADDSYADGASFSSKTFLASTATYDLVLKEGSEIYVTVFESDYGCIIHWYLYSETHRFFTKDYTEVYLPEWNARSMLSSQGNYYIEYEDRVISFYCDTSIHEDDINCIQSFIQSREESK